MLLALGFMLMGAAETSRPWTYEPYVCHGTRNEAGTFKPEEERAFDFYFAIRNDGKIIPNMDDCLSPVVCKFSKDEFGLHLRRSRSDRFYIEEFDFNPKLMIVRYSAGYLDGGRGFSGACEVDKTFKPPITEP